MKDNIFGKFLFCLFVSVTLLFPVTPLFAEDSLIDNVWGVISKESLYSDRIDQTELRSVIRTMVASLNDSNSHDENQETLRSVVRTMVASLNDPNSRYEDPETFKKNEAELSGETFVGIGASLYTTDNTIFIDKPFKNSPAHRAGLKRGDIIVSVDGQDITTLSLREVVMRIRGQEGTEVSITIKRLEEDEPILFKIRRESFQLLNLYSEIINDRIGYIEANSFGPDLSSLLKKTALDFDKSGRKIEGIILDLRNNFGGMLDQAVYLCGAFSNPAETVIRVDSLNGSYWKRNWPPFFRLFPDVPIVVLINNNSASASEIVAGFMREKNKAILVGKKSYGKGTVQQVFDSLPIIGGHLIITVAEYFLPSGTKVDGVGITPDIEVDFEIDFWEEYDSQMLKALEVLNQKIKEERIN